MSGTRVPRARPAEDDGLRGARYAVIRDPAGAVAGLYEAVG